MLSLIRTRPDFEIAGYGTRRVPVFIDRPTMEIFWPATAWMIYLATVPGSTRSPNTWSTYANGLLEWLRTCEVNGWDWRSPDFELVAHYRNAMTLLPSSYAERILSNATINGYVRALCLFYRWAHRNGFVSVADFLHQLDTASERRDARESFHGRNPLLLPSDSDHTPRFYSRPEVQRILSLQSPRAALISAWGVETGARRHEIAALTVEDVRRLMRSDVAFGILRLAVTKGSRKRDLFVPRSLIDRTARYIATHRRLIHPNARHHQALWLTQRGDGVSPKTITSEFVAARKLAGVEGTFHDLRHTFAINMLDRLFKARFPDGSSVQDPLQALQRLLGHRSPTSTARYLTARKLYLSNLWDEESDVFAELVDAAV